MPYGVQFGYGIQRLIDSRLRYLRASHPVYLRLRDFPDVQGSAWAQLGFVTSPSGAATGTTDVLIEPRPATQMVSLHNIGASMGKLRFGARTFLVSATFVEHQQKLRNLSQQEMVWRNPDVVGLVLENKLFSIEDVAHEEAAGRTVSWVLTCNANELR